MTQIWFRRILTICPVLVALLWVAGIMRFRELELEPVEWAALVAIGFALHLIHRRFRRPRPLPPLPERANPSSLALFAAVIVGVVVALLGAVFEWFVETYRPSPVPLALRAVWHGACALAAAYCGFLLRLQIAAEQPPPDAGGQPPPDEGSG